jgi:hypothetical protein
MGMFEQWRRFHIPRGRLQASRTEYRKYPLASGYFLPLYRQIDFSIGGFGQKCRRAPLRPAGSQYPPYRMCDKGAGLRESGHWHIACYAL